MARPSPTMWRLKKEPVQVHVDELSSHFLQENLEAISGAGLLITGPSFTNQYLEGAKRVSVAFGEAKSAIGVSELHVPEKLKSVPTKLTLQVVDPRADSDTLIPITGITAVYSTEFLTASPHETEKEFNARLEQMFSHYVSKSATCSVAKAGAGGFVLTIRKIESGETQPFVRETFLEARERLRQQVKKFIEP